MKSLLNTLILLAFMLVYGVIMTSCDDRNDGLEENDTNDVESINAAFSMDLSQTWFDLYNITVYYFDENGNENKQVVTNKWEYCFSFNHDMATRKFLFEVLATPKKPLPEIDKEQYILSENIQAKFFGIGHNGSTYELLKPDLNPVSNTWSDTYTFSKSQMTDFITAGTRFIASYTYTYDGKCLLKR